MHAVSIHVQNLLASSVYFFQTLKIEVIYPQSPHQTLTSLVALKFKIFWVGSMQAQANGFLCQNENTF